MRANGTRTPKELERELAAIDNEISAVTVALNVLVDRLSGDRPVSAAGAAAWNALHDAVTALEAERRTVELNAPYADATTLLIAENRD